MYKYHKIRDLQEDNDISQVKCAAKLYVSKNTYIRYETGERITQIDFMERVADLYGVTLEYLCDREPRREPQESEKDTK